MRKPEFKAKELDTEKWVFGYYYQDEDLHFIMGLDNYHYLIDPSTLCRKITEIGETKIFEFDCYWDGYYLYYCHYDNLSGHLIQQEYLINKDGSLYQIKYSSGIIALNYYSIFKRAKFIGNWHDGEQYLLDKIKDLGNE
jgi:hypothetical protein